MPKLVKLPSAEAGAIGAQLPYRLELWDEAGEGVERVLALSSTPAVGYAAYYAAIREYLDRRVALTCDGRVLAASGRPR